MRPKNTNNKKPDDGFTMVKAKEPVDRGKLLETRKGRYEASFTMARHSDPGYHRSTSVGDVTMTKRVFESGEVKTQITRTNRVHTHLNDQGKPVTLAHTPTGVGGDTATGLRKGAVVAWNKK